uniref:hypothetical protein n=1 Tax=Salmonella sp. TaxID=599 RepID=UPI001CDA42F4|nr:hypothetical protein [Salmonella sp.]
MLEVSVVMVDGKPVVLENVPSNRTIDISIDDNALLLIMVEILDTDTGRIVQGMINSGAGGWSYYIWSRFIGIPVKVFPRL